jgi:multidrug efflux pump subunit AcrB
VNEFKFLGRNVRTVDDLIEGLFGLFVVLPSVASFAFALLFVGMQCLYWLNYATLPQVSLHQGLDWYFETPFNRPFRTGMLGLDQVLHWLLDVAPITLWFAILLPATWLLLGSLLFQWLFLFFSPSTGRQK